MSFPKSLKNCAFNTPWLCLFVAAISPYSLLYTHYLFIIAPLLNTEWIDWTDYFFFSMMFLAALLAILPSAWLTALSPAHVVQLTAFVRTAIYCGSLGFTIKSNFSKSFFPHKWRWLNFLAMVPLAILLLPIAYAVVPSMAIGMSGIGLWSLGFALTLPLQIMAIELFFRGPFLSAWLDSSHQTQRLVRIMMLQAVSCTICVLLWPLQASSWLAGILLALIIPSAIMPSFKPQWRFYSECCW